MHFVKPRLHQRNMLRENKLRAIARNMLLATCCLKQHVARNKQLVASIKQHVACCPQQDARPRNMLRWCKRGITVNTEY